MAANTLFSGRPSLRQVFACLSLFYTLISAQSPPTYSPGTTTSCPGAAAGTNVTLTTGGVFTLYCDTEVGGFLENVTVTTVSTRQKYQWRSSNVANFLQICSSMLVLPHAKATPAAAPPAGIAHKFVHSSLPQARYLPGMRTLDVILE